jgi:hypothetical protein
MSNLLCPFTLLKSLPVMRAACRAEPALKYFAFVAIQTLWGVKSLFQPKLKRDSIK